MKPKLDMEKIAKGLRAERRGEVRATSGHFGATQLAAEVQARFRAPSGGGRSTDPSWTEKRLVPFAPSTRERLEHLAALLSKQGKAIAPLQLAALLLEQAVETADESFVAELASRRVS